MSDKQETFLVPNLNLIYNVESPVRPYQAFHLIANANAAATFNLPMNYLARIDSPANGIIDSLVNDIDADVSLYELKGGVNPDEFDFGTLTKESIFGFDKSQHVFIRKHDRVAVEFEKAASFPIGLGFRLIAKPISGPAYEKQRKKDEYIALSGEVSEILIPSPNLKRMLQFRLPLEDILQAMQKERHTAR